MLFNSIDFLFFLPIVFFLYWFVFKRNLKLQNLFIVVASYLFYGWWDWKFLLLIGFTSLCSWVSGIFILKIREKSFNSEKEKKLSVTVTALNIILNLTILGFFKYYNFFVENFIEAFSLFGKQFNIHTLKIILPVGISFYTFQALSYTIDVYYRKLAPTKDIISFFAFISFFPQLVAGPIERATNLLPQFQKRRYFDYSKAIDGTRQILWGFLKKIVIADNCAYFANLFFNNSNDYSGANIFIGAFFFTFQIYGDFSGYSDIAIGTSRLFGINLMRNFNYPYFSRDIAEFWRRWHISLTTWFRDYVYIPLGGSRGGKWLKTRNTFIIFLLSGFWHGANWTFIIWGLYHAFLFLPLILSNKNRKYTNTIAEGKRFPTMHELLQMCITFLLVLIGWIFFRADNISHAWECLSKIFSPSLFIFTDFAEKFKAIIIVCLIVIFLIIEWIGREQQFALEKLGLNWKKSIRYAVYFIIAVMIAYYTNRGQAEFIYFQF